MTNEFNADRRRIIVGAASLAAGGVAFGGAATAQSGAVQTEGSKTGDPDLTGKSILITGSSSGFGRLGAEHYARLGAKVFATMRNTPRPEANALRDLAARDGLDIHVIDIDVLSDVSISEGVAEALGRANGTIDVLINNAGIGITGPVEVQDMAATELMFETNVFGCHRMARAVLPAMRAAGSGQIFQISSQLGRLIVPGAGHYSATKFALEAMSEQLAYEVHPLGVDVTIIQPGGYPTDIWVNRNRYTAELKARSDDNRLGAYPEMAAAMGAEDGTGRTTDPMDVPRAIAAIIAVPRGTRPLRKAVHPAFRPQEAVNEAMAEAQIGFLGSSPYGPVVRSVNGRKT